MTFLTAATTLLLRPGSDGPQVALLERNPKLLFLGRFWVFPGGSAEEGESPERAALREAFEDTGLLLVPGAEGLDERALAASRERLLRDEVPFTQVLADHGVDAASAGSRLVPCGRWKTPPFSARRFDTHFLLCAVPAETALQPEPQLEGAADAREIFASDWLTPDEALAGWGRDEHLLAPPTRVSLEALAAFVRSNPGQPEDAEWLARAAAAIAASHPPDGEWHDFLDFRPGIRLVPLLTPTLPPATHTNCLVVGDGSEVVVIDPASPYEDEQARLAGLLSALVERGVRVREVLLTHHHPDHCSGAEDLSERFGAPIAAHANTRKRLEGRVRVDRLIEDGDLIELPADRPGARPRKLRAILTEGHADGHLVYHEEVSDSLIAGDMVAGIGTIVVDPPEGRMSDYLASLRLVADLDATLLYPSHGPPIGDPRGYAEHYITHRLGREAKVLSALEALGACDLDALVPLAYDDKPPQIWPLAKRAALAHLNKLVEDGAAHCPRPGTWSLSERVNGASPALP